MKTTHYCNGCESVAEVRRRTSDQGTFYACREHAKYLAGWVNDARYEARCEARDVARYDNFREE